MNEKVSKCIYCGSTSYGKGCPYSPHKFHVHAPNTGKCIYCGSTSLGTGCPYNPFGNIHIRGVDFNSMTKESAINSFSLCALLRTLITPLSESIYAKRGDIDANGVVINESLPLVDRYIIRIKKLFNEKNLDLFNTSVLLEHKNENKQEKFDSKIYNAELQVKEEACRVVSDIEGVVARGMDRGLSKERVDKLMIEAIIEFYDVNQKNQS